MSILTSLPVFIARTAPLLRILAVATFLATAGPIDAQAQNRWWDGSGSSNGFQVANGDFGTSTLWNTNSSGVGTLIAWPGGTAIINATNGTNNITVNTAVSVTNFLLANSPADGTTTTVNLSGSSTLAVATNVQIGASAASTNATAAAILNQSGGTITGTTFQVGRQGAAGTWNLSGGSATGNSLQIATEVQGGSNGLGIVAPVGTVTISGGSMTMTSSVLVGVRGASNYTAIATLNMDGGTLTTTNINIGFGNNVTGTVNLNGGTMTVANVLKQGGTTNATATFRFNGGTLRSATNSTGFMGGLNNAFVDSGGAFIDIDGKTSTISQALLQGTGAGGLTLSSTAGGGTLTLSGTNTFTGTTTVNGGILQILGGNALSDTASVVLANTLGAGLNVNATERIGGLQGGGGTGGTVTIAGSQTLTVSNQSTHHIFSGVVAGAGALTKAGSGTQTLAGDNTYGGATTISGGSLIINGNQSGAGGILNVASGATLGGSGTIGGTTIISGVLAPGNSIGTLTVANDVTWNGGNSWIFELGTAAPTLAGASTGGSTQDLLAITGTGSDFLKGTGSAWTFDFAGTGDFGWYKLVDWTGGATTFDALDFSGVNLRGVYTSEFSIQNNALYVNVVPEPSTYALLALAGAGLAFRCVRRRRID